MDAQNFWFSSGTAGGGGGGDEGAEIANSLRFRANQRLVGPDARPSTGDFTVSFWFKRAGAVDSVDTMTFLSFAGNQSYQIRQNVLIARRNTNFPQLSDGLLRDPSAWYHVLLSSVASDAAPGGTTTLHLNGVEMNSAETPQGNTVMTIGSNSSTGTDNPFQGYLAEYYFIEGDALEPEAFGRENDQGIWVPITPDIDQAEIWSNDLTCSGAGFDADRPAVDAFDGVNTNFAASGFANETITWTPTGGFDFTASVQVRTPRADNRARINGGAWTDLTQNGNTTITTGSGTIETIEVEGVGNTAAVAQFFVDGARVNDTNGDYGETGFHLDFSDPDNIGEDSSGNGNNFTNSGFNFDPVGVFSENLFTGANGSTGFDFDARDTNFAAAPNGPVSGFDGDNSTFVFAQANQSINLVCNLTGITNLVVRTDQTQTYSFAVNETAVTATRVIDGGAARQTLDLPDDFDGNLTLLSIRGSSTTMTPGFSSIFINNNADVLVDNEGEDYDSMTDSPTQNFATLNPLRPVSGTMSRANLTLTGAGTSNWSCRDSTLYLNGGRAYWEIQCITRAQTVLGVGRDSFDANNTDTFPGQANNGQSIGLDDDGGLRSDGTTTTNWSASYNPGDILSFALDLNAGALWIGINGTWQNGATEEEIEDGTTTNAARTGMEGTWRPVNSATAGAFDANYGQKPFVHDVPAGFNRLQTQNLPTPTILNGRDNFGVLTYNGNGDGQTIGTNFVPDLIWFKTRTASNDHLLVDSVRGGDRGVFSNLTATENTSNQYVTDFDDDGSIVTGTATEINDDTQQQVAWYWRAPDAWASTDADITAGTRASNGRRNVAAGFSIVSFDGTGGDTIAHGLSERPELILDKDLEDEQNWRVFHYMMDDGDVEWDVSDNLHLNLTDAYPPGRGANTRIDQVRDTFFRISGGNAGNARIAYCWHSIPGYSAFGSYEGNGLSDGPFVYTGFRPAFVMIKCTSQGTADVTNWFMQDSTREISNPCNDPLAANTDNTEYGFSGALIDLLSNGFKLQGGPDQMNGNHTYIYAAFAENPIGGENTAPVTAR